MKNAKKHDPQLNSSKILKVTSGKLIEMTLNTVASYMEKLVNEDKKYTAIFGYRF